MVGPVAKQYRYVGPAEIKNSITGAPGTAIRCKEDLAEWVRSQQEGAQATATYVVDAEGVLRVAPRRSEHVACAGGGTVCAAGELAANDLGEIVEASNQSTGYCPDPSCWHALRTALDAAAVPHPGGWTSSFTFRRCESCDQRCIVKDDWFMCDVCDSELPAEWNF